MAGDLILTNGHIITSDPARPIAEAVAIRNGLITAVGANADALAEQRAGAEVIDLHGRTATAAFNDAHCHPMYVGFTAAAINARPEAMASINQLIGTVRERAASFPPDRWIRARGYDDARFDERRHPNRADLDVGAPEHPVIVVRACGHIAAVNSKALQLAGITAATRDPEGGVIDRDEHGEPTGILREIGDARRQRHHPAAERGRDCGRARPGRRPLPCGGRHERRGGGHPPPRGDGRLPDSPRPGRGRPAHLPDDDD